jgi:hypothetical protein
MARAAADQQQRTLERRLWDAANAQRSNQEPSECGHVEAEHFSHVDNVGADSKPIRTMQGFETHVESSA